MKRNKLGHLINAKNTFISKLYSMRRQKGKHINHTVTVCGSSENDTIRNERRQKCGNDEDHLTNQKDPRKENNSKYLPAGKVP